MKSENILIEGQILEFIYHYINILKSDNDRIEFVYKIKEMVCVHCGDLCGTYKCSCLRDD